jgi:hypothetical protein
VLDWREAAGSEPVYDFDLRLYGVPRRG